MLTYLIVAILFRSLAALYWERVLCGPVEPYSLLSSIFSSTADSSIALPFATQVDRFHQCFEEWVGVTANYQGLAWQLKPA